MAHRFLCDRVSVSLIKNKTRVGGAAEIQAHKCVLPQNDFDFSVSDTSTFIASFFSPLFN